jgi:hypothetical protein
MTQVPFAILLTTPLLLLPAILPPGALAQGRVGSQAAGQADLVAGDGAATVSFSAVAQGDGTARGYIDFRDPTPQLNQDVDGSGDPALADAPSGVTLHAEVNCLALVGTTAIVGGEVTSAEPDRYVGKQILLFVEDSGRARGGFTWGFYEPQAGAYCGTFPWAAYTPVPVLGGSFRVQQ